MSKNKIHVVNNNLSNIGSILRMLNEHSIEVVVTSSAEELSKASKLILPGVGHFRKGSERLDELEIRDVLTYLALKKGIPILGICLGMQMLFDSSAEAEEEVKGLSLVAGRCEKIIPGPYNLKIPHMGWNNVLAAKNSVLLKGISDPRFYFVHSYHAVSSEKEVIVGTAEYGQSITAVIEAENIMGTQFHPEKSHKFGKALFHNFVNI